MRLEGQEDEERQQCSSSSAAAVTQGKVGITALNCHEISGMRGASGEKKVAYRTSAMDGERGSPTKQRQ